MTKESGVTQGHAQAIKETWYASRWPYKAVEGEVKLFNGSYKIGHLYIKLKLN